MASSGCAPATVPSARVSAASDVLTTVPRAVVAVPLTRIAAVRERPALGPVRATTLVTTGLSCSCVFSIERV